MYPSQVLTSRSINVSTLPKGRLPVHAHTRANTRARAAQRAKLTSHRLALCLLIMCAPIALIALGFINWGFSNLGLVTVQ
jgi:hypothetical protein